MSAPPSERSVVLVISPLVSLMVYQVSHLHSVGVSAAILSGNKGVDKKYQAVGSDISEGKYRLVYSSPEALFTSDQWTQMMLEPPLSKCLVAIANTVCTSGKLLFLYYNTRYIYVASL